MFHFLTSIAAIKAAINETIYGTNAADAFEVDDEWQLLLSTPLPNLTFDIELQLVIITNGGDENDERDNDFINKHGREEPWSRKNIYSHIVAELAKMDLSIVVGEPDNRRWKPEYDELWQVMRDMSIKSLEARRGQVPWGVKIVSPVLKFDMESLSAVKKVCDMMKAKFRIQTNDSTGLLVRVGNHKNGFDFLTMRRLVAMLWTFDPQISTIHSDYRRERSPYCTGLRNRSQLYGTFVQKGIPANNMVFAGVETILRYTENITELMSVIIADPVANFKFRPAYYLGEAHRLYRPAKVDNTEIVEFRQHDATVEAERVLHWISLCVRIVEFARQAHSETAQANLHAFLTLHAPETPSQFPIGAMLRAMGMIEEAEFYENQVPTDEKARKYERNRRRRHGESEDDDLYTIYQ